MSLRSIYAASAASALAIDATPPRAEASAGFGRNAAMYPRARDQRVARVGLDLMLRPEILQSLARQGEQTKRKETVDLPVTVDAISRAVAARNLPEALAPSDYLNHGAGTTAVPIAPNAAFDASLTVTGTDYQLLALQIGEEFQGVRITSFKIGRELDRIVSGEMTIDGFSAMVSKILAQPHPTSVRRDDVITLEGVNRTGGPIVFCATWFVRDLDQRCAKR